MNPLEYFKLLLTDYEFCRDFWSSLLSDLIVGGLLSLLIGIVLNRSQERTERKEEERKSIEKTKRYLRTFLEEVSYQVEEIPDYLRAFEEDGFRIYVMLPTLWRNLQPSSDLFRRLSPDLLANLSAFYGYLDIAQSENTEFRNQLSRLESLQIWNVKRTGKLFGLIKWWSADESSSKLRVDQSPHYKAMQMSKKLMIGAFEKALKQGEILQEAITTEIEVLESRLSKR
jgi:hypothetical protein